MSNNNNNTSRKLDDLERRFGSTQLRPSRPGMVLPTFPQPRPRQRDTETEKKLQQIMKRSGIITIDNVEYKTELKDLEDLGELGNGTSGHVFKMRHKPTNKVIAVKQMRRTNNQEEEKRIIMDIDVVLKSHDCPYIVHCIGCFITEAEVWICMELMSTCFDKLTKKSRQSVPEAILGKITVATVKALSYLKTSHDVIHRDVKPSNILIDERGNIKLCDFGISGRLVDSKAKTRSAGCAAYMAPERIDPKKPEYDIRADVWSLGITLVELATGSFPYNGCSNDFEVLTCVLERDPPRLPTDQGFSLEFQDFVSKCLTKDYHDRPKYPELLESDFIKMYENADVDIVNWFASVMHTNNQQPNNNTELRRQPSLVVDKTKINLVPSSIEPTTVTTSHIPVYQPFSHHLLNQSTNQLSNGFNAETQPSNSNPFQRDAISMDPSKTASVAVAATADGQQHKPIETQLAELSMSPPCAISSPSFAQQFSPSLSRTSSMSDRDHITESPLPMMPNFLRGPLQSSGRSVENFSPLPKLNPLLVASKSPTPMMEPSMTIPRNDEFSPRISNFNYGYAQPEPILAPEHHFRQAVSPQMLHFQQIEEKMVDQLNELYKATMMMHANQRDIQQRPELDEVDRINQQPYGQHEPIYNPGQQNHLHRNNSLSPFLQRKYSLQAHQQRLNDQNVSRWRTPQYGRSISATASPNLDAHRRYQTAIPVLDTDKPPIGRLTGNTSPIVLQRFYHQQSQLREKEANGQAYNHPSQVSHSQLKAEYEKRINELNDKEHHQSNPFLRQLPKLTHKLNPFKQQSSPKLNAREEPLYANSHIPVYQKHYGHYDGVPKENTHLQRIPINPPAEIYSDKTVYPTITSDDNCPNEYKNVYNATTTSSVGKDKKTNGTKHTEDPGWFNSIAGIVKRRFASYVKSHLATSSGDSSKKDRDHFGKHPMQPTSPYHFDKLRHGTPTSLSTPSSPHFGNRSQFDHYEKERMAAHSPRVLNNVDRRHRSPDPPPRYNKGQSPLLLRRNLLEYGNHQVAPSPLLPRRYIISTSPPLPPPRKGSDSIPGSPQQLRARIHYTPEPQRRIYRTSVDQ